MRQVDLIFAKGKSGKEIELTIDEAEENHKRLWFWLAENPVRDKHEWPEWTKNGGNIKFARRDCFACEISSYCGNCKIIWPGDKCGGTCGHLFDEPGLYGQWCASEGLDSRRVELAIQIANLPWREEIEGE